MCRDVKVSCVKLRSKMTFVRKGEKACSDEVHNNLRDFPAYTEVSIINCSPHTAPHSSSTLNGMNRFYLWLVGCNFYCNTWSEGGKKGEAQGEGWCANQCVQNEQLALVSHKGWDVSVIFCRCSKHKGVLPSHDLPAPYLIRNLIRQIMNIHWRQCGRQRNTRESSGD